MNSYTEQIAAAMYREKHPDGPKWQDLHRDTRAIWIEVAEKYKYNAAVSRPREAATETPPPAPRSA